LFNEFFSRLNPLSTPPSLSCIACCPAMAWSLEPPLPLSDTALLPCVQAAEVLQLMQ
jgi:hypothetical protein